MNKRTFIVLGFNIVITAYLFLLTNRCVADDMSLTGVPQGHYFMTLQIAQQAIMCDIAGVGSIADIGTEKINIKIEQLWYGNFPTNYITLHYNEGEYSERISDSTNVMFFATTNLWWALIGTSHFPGSARLYTSDFITNQPPVGKYSTTNYTVINDMRLAFPVLSVDDPLAIYASNLVHTAKIDSNPSEFQQLLYKNATNDCVSVARDVSTYVIFRENMLPRDLLEHVNKSREKWWNKR